METETIIISVLMPILLGPLYVLLKELWDRYKNHNTEIKKNLYFAKYLLSFEGTLSVSNHLLGA